MAKPMIATDVPGCRDVVRSGENGLLCEPRSATSLAKVLSEMLSLDDEERRAMGARARKMVEAEFGQALVAEAYLEELE
jgi:glycosyltransferase involved in cell wall biosynthesis